jgi:hypothetical protein
MDDPNAIFPVSIPEWMLDPELFDSTVSDSADYFNRAPDPVVGVASDELGFRVVHRLAGETFYNSDREYKQTVETERGLEWGDIVSLGRSRNLRDGQFCTILVRILARVATPAEYAHYMVFRFTYTVLVE